MATTADYADKTIDLNIMLGAKEVGKQAITLSFGDEGEINTGIQKLAQTFLVLLLTDKGSVSFDTKAGCDFYYELINGYIKTDLDLQLAFNSAVLSILNYLSKFPSDNPDENLKTAILKAFVLNKDSVSLTVQLTTESGTARKVILPINYPIK